MEQNLGNRDMSNQSSEDLFKGAKSLKEYAGKTFSGGSIAPGDPLCMLLPETLVKMMEENKQMLLYDMGGNIYQMTTIPESKD